jgi:hypothetical protein
MKVRIYSSHCSRPDYILFQYNSIKKHVKDDEVEFIVVNDGQNEATISNFMNPSCRDDIDAICKELNIKCIPLNPELHRKRNLLYPTKVNPVAENYSQRCADVSQFMLRESLPFDGIVCMIDSDVFFWKDISFNEFMKGYNLSYIPTIRKDIHYIWNNLVLYKPQELPNLHELNFDLGSIPGNPLDSGGMTHEYLLKYKSSLRIRIIEITSFPMNNEKTLEEKSSYEVPSLCRVLQDSLESEIPIDFSFEWEVFGDKLIHYGQGGNWNKKGYYEHCIKTKTFLWFLASSLLAKKNS